MVATAVVECGKGKQTHKKAIITKKKLKNGVSRNKAEWGPRENEFAITASAVPHPHVW